MRKSADVVIRMQQGSENIKLLFPDRIDWDVWRSQRSDVPYSEDVISFLDELSNALLHDKNARSYPDVMTFAFFCRRANIMKCKEQTAIKELRLGRGVLFHIAPSNVPINFAFSLVAGLLAGNGNVVRVSSIEFPQVDLIVNYLKSFSETNRWPSVLQRIALVQYDRGDQATSFFSSFCQVRIIWGGDATINQIRKSQI
ncbi:MAG: acyl-CoA reductase, partial [Paludibacteraceae bacterium]|nr:acyl-CoA reductase [Paludibacteraceae bacterium]